MVNLLKGKKTDILSSFSEFFTTLDTPLMSKYSSFWRNLILCDGVFLANLKFVLTMILLILFEKNCFEKKDFVHLHNNAPQQIQSYKIEFVHHTVPYNMNKKSLYEHMVYQD